MEARLGVELLGGEWVVAGGRVGGGCRLEDCGEEDREGGEGYVGAEEHESG